VKTQLAVRRLIVRKTLLVGCVFALLLSAQDSQPKPVKDFGGKIEEIYRLRLDKGDLLLEFISNFIKKSDLRDGAVLTAAGSLEECTFHGVGGKVTTVKEQMEVNHLGGIIADGEPHFHVVLSNAARGAFGGHLEKGCRVLSHIELTIARFSGPALHREKGSLTTKR
jgi:uncharacterized protein